LDFKYSDTPAGQHICNRPLLPPFFLNHTATTHIHSLSLHDALPIFEGEFVDVRGDHEIGTIGDDHVSVPLQLRHERVAHDIGHRSEEHTSELQSRGHLVCRLLLEKKKKDKGRRYASRATRSWIAALS